MKSLERFQLLANVLIVACSRPNAEVGRLVKAVVTYVTEGTRTDLGDLRLESVLMRWMKPEPIIQSEVSQKKNTSTVSVQSLSHVQLFVTP